MPRFLAVSRQLIVEAAGDCAHLRLGLVERHGRSKSSNDEPRFSAAHALAGRVRLPHVCVEPRDLEIGREDADDLARKAIEHERRAERIVRASESRLPEAMTDQDQPLPLLGFFGRKAAPQDGLDTEEWKQVGGDARADDLLHAVSSGQQRGHGIEGGHVREALTLTPPLFDIPKCRSALAKVLGRILGPQHRQLFRGPIRKGPEQNGIQDAEHCSVGANRQRQGGGGCRCESSDSCGESAPRSADPGAPRRAMPRPRPGACPPSPTRRSRTSAGPDDALPLASFLDRCCPASRARCDRGCPGRGHPARVFGRSSCFTPVPQGGGCGLWHEPACPTCWFRSGVVCGLRGSGNRTSRVGCSPTCLHRT